ncbi:MAG: hypothetical protein LBW85_07800 [Deltaproteobacteria bacterium]|nr:hypothetical protein [Deltaproteobacteria bacterium]
MARKLIFFALFIIAILFISSGQDAIGDEKNPFLGTYKMLKSDPHKMKARMYELLINGDVLVIFTEDKVLMTSNDEIIQGFKLRYTNTNGQWTACILDHSEEKCDESHNFSISGDLAEFKADDGKYHYFMRRISGTAQ